jgi:hypothetical protein
MLNGRRQPSLGRTSRVNREVYARFCEGLGVRFPRPTRHCMHGLSGGRRLARKRASSDPTPLALCIFSRP